MNNPASKDCRVVIFDDEIERAREVWKRDLLDMGLKNLLVHVPEPKEIQLALNQLHARRAKADKGESAYDTECSLDNVDVLIVDYDLRHLEDHQGFATGEEIAYAARLFSKVKIIVVVNHPDIGLNDFDLTLQRDRNLKADVYVGHEQIANPGLWCHKPGHNGFVPWNWPVLLEDVANFDQCAAQVRANWNENILSYFGLNLDETKPSLEMLAFLGMTKGGMTFDEVYRAPPVNRTRPFVRPKDLPALLSDQDRLSVVMTAVLKKWLRRWVLPAQTVLADAPHLAVTLPWALKEYQNQAQWLEVPKRGMSDAGHLNDIFKPEVLANSFKFTEWLGRPAFFAQKARNALEVEIEHLKTFEFGKIPQLLFAEDLSRFIPTVEAIEYDLLLDGQAQVRSVHNVSFPITPATRYDPKPVVYVPQSLMA